MGQCVFAGLYLLNALVVLLLAASLAPSSSSPSGLALWGLVLVASRRVISIWVLRLFNDPLASLLALLAVRLVSGSHYTLAVAFLSLSVGKG
jgi:hypothetical protein